MSSTTDESIEAKLGRLSARVDSLALGVKVAALAVLLLFSLFNIADTFAISYFRQLFIDSLPGRRLPAITNFFLDHQTAVTLVAVLWPVVGLVALWRVKRVSTFMIVISVLVVLVSFQLVLNWIAHFLPLIELTQTMGQ